MEVDPTEPDGRGARNGGPNRDSPGGCEERSIYGLDLFTPREAGLLPEEVVPPESGGVLRAGSLNVYLPLLAAASGRERFSTGSTWACSSGDDRSGSPDDVPPGRDP